MLDMQVVGRELGDGEFWRLSIDERDLLLRSCVFGAVNGIPDAEVLSKRGSVVWRLMEAMRDLGVDAGNLYSSGVFVWGFYDRGLYSDEWLSGVYEKFNLRGGLEGVLASLRVLGVSDGLIYELRGVPLDDIADMGVSAEVIVSLSKMDEDSWFRELSLLLADAKESGDRGFGVRRDILMMVGKKKGFISQEFGDGAVAAFISGLTAKSMRLVERIEAKSREVSDGE